MKTSQKIESQVRSFQNIHEMLLILNTMLKYMYIIHLYKYTDILADYNKMFVKNFRCI